MTGVILAGGNGVRIGGNKPAALLAGRPLLQWAIDALQQVVGGIVLAVAPGQQLPAVRAKVPLYTCEDLLPARGPVTGIFTGLRCADRDDALVIPCDAPLIGPGVLRLLMHHRRGFDAVVPEVNGRIETAFGVYAQSCVPALIEALNSGDLSVRSLLPALRVNTVAEHEIRKLDPALRSFVNVNTRDDLAEVEALLSATVAS